MMLFFEARSRISGRSSSIPLALLSQAAVPE
jgi:hypothetical protein